MYLTVGTRACVCVCVCPCVCVRVVCMCVWGGVGGRASARPGGSGSLVRLVTSYLSSPSSNYTERWHFGTLAELETKSDIKDHFSCAATLKKSRLQSFLGNYGSMWPSHTPGHKVPPELFYLAAAGKEALRKVTQRR
uniref:Uncharacterized protein n=1 Tax=Pipistrellus kuhlii TaxID=59472 RepID=A0A7J7XAZ3_PIPKU|nr:hypothetical protein mPipKuh1_010586 [Pipistrellus kuhlii]